MTDTQADPPDHFDTYMGELRHEVERLRASNKQLREALEKAREKLKIECGQEYKGGMPTQFLYPLIDAALKDGDKT